MWSPRTLAQAISRFSRHPSAEDAIDTVNSLIDAAKAALIEPQVVYLLIEHEPKSDYPVCIVGAYATAELRAAARWAHLAHIREARPAVTIYGESVCACGRPITEEATGWRDQRGLDLHVNPETEQEEPHEPQGDPDDWDLELIEEDVMVQS